MRYFLKRITLNQDSCIVNVVEDEKVINKLEVCNKCITHTSIGIYINDKCNRCGNIRQPTSIAPTSSLGSIPTTTKRGKLSSSEILTLEELLKKGLSYGEISSIMCRDIRSIIKHIEKRRKNKNE